MSKTFVVLFMLVNFSIFGQAQGVKVEKFAVESANRLMAGITPDNGNSPGAYVYHWEYSSLLNRYTIHFMAIWYAKTCLFCSAETRFEVTGFLEIDRDGQNPIYSETARNQAIKDVIGKKPIDELIEKKNL